MHSKSALTDHANQVKNTIDWKKTTVIDREQDRPIPGARKLYISARKVTDNRAMNRDEGSYQSSHAYDRFLDATADRHIKTHNN